MTGVRSSRQLEAACREQLPYLWLAGGQHPDHNTLWRFYQAHRAGMRGLLRKTIESAAALDLIDWDLQAVDGTKIQGDTSNRLTFSEEQLQRLEQRTLREIEQLEAAHEIGNASAPNLTGPIAEARASLHRIRMAQHQLRLSPNQRFVSQVDADARMMRRPHGGTLTGSTPRPSRRACGPRDGRARACCCWPPRSRSRRSTRVNCHAWSRRLPKSDERS